MDSSVISHHLESMAKSLHDITISAAGPIDHVHSASSNLLHVVMVPYPVQGQINPMLNLAKSLLANYPDQLIVTFVNIKHHHDRILHSHSTSTHLGTSPISPSSSQNPEKIKLNLTWVDNGLPPDFDYTDMASSMKEFHLSTYNMKAPLKHLLQTSRIPVSCVFFGTFCAWAHSTAAELGIPSFMFWTQSAAMFSLYYHWPLLAENGFFAKAATDDKCSEDVDGSSTNVVSYIPGIPPLHRSSFPTLLQVNDVSDPSLELLKEQFGVLGDCNGVIINSFEELERDTCRALRAELPSSISVSLVGPVLPSAFWEREDITEAGVSKGRQLVVEDKSDQCLKWLDSKPKRSVLYISFGTLFSPSMEELEAIANGINASGQPFLWVIRPKSSIPAISNILPPSFVKDTEDRGLIVPWAPQVEVLSHPSVGAFLTHCGWNSTLESLSMGMPMIAYPILTDQPTNCAFVCDVWEVGMALKGRHGELVESTSVDRAVRAMMEGEEGKRMRERAGELKEAARSAVRAQGSSYMAMEKLVGDIKHDVRNRQLV